VNRDGRTVDTVLISTVDLQTLVEHRLLDLHLAVAKLAELVDDNTKDDIKQQDCKREGWAQNGQIGRSKRI
jgi:hypothetical protein